MIIYHHFFIGIRYRSARIETCISKYWRKISTKTDADCCTKATQYSNNAWKCIDNYSYRYFPYSHFSDQSWCTSSRSKHQTGHCHWSIHCQSSIYRILSEFASSQSGMMKTIENNLTNYLGNGKNTAIYGVNWRSWTECWRIARHALCSMFQSSNRQHVHINTRICLHCRSICESRSHEFSRQIVCISIYISVIWCFSSFQRRRWLIGQSHQLRTRLQSTQHRTVICRKGIVNGTLQCLKELLNKWYIS